MKTLIFDKGFEYLQDVYGTAEKWGIEKPDFNPAYIGFIHDISGYEPLPRLGHLQMVFERQPYYGTALRVYNMGAYWYRLKFVLPEDAGLHTVIRIGAADYFADVWLNGVLLGSHRGYFHSFEFSADGAVRKNGEVNCLLIKVTSPWDPEIVDGARCGGIVRHMVKGTYENADPFGSRDLNPIGLWKPVEIDCFDGNRISGVQVRTEYDNAVTGRIIANVSTDRPGALLRMRVIDRGTGRTVYTSESTTGRFEDTLTDILPWNSYERGTPALYTVTFSLVENNTEIQSVSRTVGFRNVELRRTPEKTEYYLNGNRIFIRGVSYLPDFYVSAVTPNRIRRDINDMKSLGVNMVRVHVHAQIPEFYEICDEAGMMVMQDSDLNWTTENGEDFLPHIMGVWAELIDHCGYHPCVCTMVCENEPIRDEYITERPAPQMEEYAFRVIPGMPIIRGSGRSLYTHSGDSHNYTGSLYTHVPFSYLDNGIRDTEKLNTEFGMDCPAEPSSLRQFPELSAMLSLTKEKYEELSEYQYRILKYYIEAYRIRKYNNCAGYIQFLFSDPAPQSFFGIVDFWGMPKKGYQALAESNGLYAAILEHDTVSRALWVINDSIRPLNGSLKVYLNRGGIEKQTAFYTVTVDADSSARICDFTETEVGDDLILVLTDKDGNELHRNVYRDPLVHPKHPDGHPYYLNTKYCMHYYRTIGEN